MPRTTAETPNPSVAALDVLVGEWVERSDGKGQPLHHDFDLIYRKVK